MFLLFKREGWAQNEIEISNSLLFNSPDGFDLTNCPAYIDSSKQLNTRQIETKEFKTLDFTNALNTPFAFGKQNVWFRLILHNQGKDSIQGIILSNRCDILNLYIPENYRFIEMSAGFGIPNREYSSQSVPFGFNLNIEPGATKIYYLKIENYFRLMQNIRVAIYSQTQYQNYKSRQSESRMPFLIFQSCFLACMLFMFLYTILQFSSNYYRGYVFYALFILANFFIFFRLLEFNANLRIITYWFPQFFYCFENLLTALALIFYLKFVEYFLETNLHQSYLQKFITISVYFLIGLIALDLMIIILSPYSYQNITLFAIEKFINYGILLAALIQLFFNKNILSRYVIIGTIALLFGVIIASYLAISQTVVRSAFMIPSNFAETGVILEILFFSVGLGHKSRVIEREKNRAQEQLITQLQENQKLQLLMNEQLEVQVNKRTDEVLRINKHFEEQRIQQIQSDFQKKIIETEMAALRAQMNPHFIFNCLNSINLFILKSEPDIASDYLTKFSRLIRLVLDNSRTQQVTLSDEITAIKLYIEMEALRFANKFGYEIIVNDNINIEETEIPPMILQPYVENAIWHGLMQYNGEGKINLSFSKKSNILTAIIDDNGIGRDLEQRMKSKTAIEHKSHGMKVTAERIEMINRIYDTHATVQIIDKLGDTGIAFGTTVKIEIPIKEQH